MPESMHSGGAERERGEDAHGYADCEGATVWRCYVFMYTYMIMNQELSLEIDD